MDGVMSAGRTALSGQSESRSHSSNSEHAYGEIALVLCDTHILIVNTYVTIPVSPRSRYIAVYRSSTKYRETAQVSRVSTIPCSSYHLAMCTLQACDAETNSKVAENHNYQSTTMSARAAVNKYNPISY